MHFDVGLIPIRAVVVVVVVVVAVSRESRVASVKDSSVLMDFEHA